MRRYWLVTAAVLTSIAVTARHACAEPCVVLMIEPQRDSPSATPDSQLRDSAADSRADATYDDVLQRLASELEALGFALAYAARPEQLELGRAQRVIEDSACGAVVLLSAVPHAQADVWVADRRDGRYLFGAYAEDTPLSPELLALHVAEFVRSGFIELELPRPRVAASSEPPSPPEPAPSPKPPSTPAPSTPPNVPEPSAAPSGEERRWSLGLATGVLGGPGGLASTLAFHVAGGWRFVSALHLRVDAATALSTHTSLGSAEAEVSQQLLAAGLRWTLLAARGASATGFVQPTLGVYRLSATGRANAPQQGVTDSALAMLGGAGAGAEVFLFDHVVLGALGQILVTTPRISIDFPEGTAAKAPAPLLGARLGLEVVW